MDAQRTPRLAESFPVSSTAVGYMYMTPQVIFRSSKSVGMFFDIGERVSALEINAAVAND